MINPKFISLILAVAAIALIFYYFNSANRFFRPSSSGGKFMRVCPKCGSTFIKTDFSNPIVWSSGTPSKYICTNCSHISNFFPEIEKSTLPQYKKELRNEIAGAKITSKKEASFDITPGYGVGKIEVIFLLISAVVIALIFILAQLKGA